MNRKHLIKPIIICAAIALACSMLILSGCALLPETPKHGVYYKEVVLEIAESCGEYEGRYSIGNPAYICIATHNSNDWRVIWADEADHLFRDMVGLPQPVGHKIFNK